MKNAFVLQQENQIRAPRQGNGQFAIQDLTHGNAASKVIQEARVVALEQFLYYKVVIADILGCHKKRKGPRA